MILFKVTYETKTGKKFTLIDAQSKKQARKKFNNSYGYYATITRVDREEDGK